MLLVIVPGEQHSSGVAIEGNKQNSYCVVIALIFLS
jgi:hypothetical protein